MLSGMDTFILHLFNRQLAHPALDVVMILASTIGLAALPATAIHYWLQGETKLARAILAALLLGLLATFVFQFLAWRPRPEGVRLLVAQPPFPAFPSGHAVAAFATAMVLILATRSWSISIASLLAALLIALSRIYLGQHYPTDVLAGMVLGLAVGAACYGIFVQTGQLRDRLRWLLFPQIAIAILVSMMAYMDLLPRTLLTWPYADKVMHFILWGLLAGWLHIWLPGKGWQISKQFLPLAVLIPFSIATVEEGFQSLSPLRTADLTDLAADLCGLLLFWWISRWLTRQKISETVLR